MQNTSHTKTALITGAAARIGAEIARTLHSAGMNIVIHYRASAQDAEDLAAELNQIRENSAASTARGSPSLGSAPLSIREAAEMPPEKFAEHRF